VASRIQLEFEVCRSYDETLVERKPGVIRIYSEQAEFIKKDDKFLLAFIAGMGTGKTVAGVIKCLLMAAKYPKCLGFIASPTLDMLNLTILVEMKKVFMQAGLKEKTDWVFGKAPPKEWNVHTRFIKDHGGILSFRNGAQCRIWSMAAWANLDGASYQYAYIDEVTKCDPDGVKLIMSRLRGGDKLYKGYKHQFFTTSYVNGRDDILWDMFSEESENRHPDSAYINCETSKNIFIERSYSTNLASIYTAKEQRGKIQGLWDTVLPGRIFNFDKRQHVIKGDSNGAS
jgi:hypothetical protein